MASDGADPNSCPRKDETNEYLESHKIVELFNNLTSQLIFNRPACPQKCMIETLERLDKCRTTPKPDYPCLFDDSNIQSLFGMLDPTNKGYITLKQYIEAFQILSLKDYNAQPDGHSDDRIFFDIFLQEVRAALQNAWLTCQD